MSNKNIEVEVLDIFLSRGHDFFGRYGKSRKRHEVSSVKSVECVAGRGLVGDRFYGYKAEYPGQITFLSREVIDEVIESLGLESLDVSRFRRNVIILGVDLNDLIGSLFEIDGVLFEGARECSPCFWMDQAIGEGAEELLKGRGGLRCRILETGTLSKGVKQLHLKSS